MLIRMSLCRTTGCTVPCNRSYRAVQQVVPCHTTGCTVPCNRSYRAVQQVVPCHTTGCTVPHNRLYRAVQQVVLCYNIPYFPHVQDQKNTLYIGGKILPRSRPCSHIDPILRSWQKKVAPGGLHCKQYTTFYTR